MKFDNLQSSSVEIVGDIQENKVGIRSEDAEHLIMVLSSNLYSDPIGSTVREIVSNAWDAHVEAGNPDPVIITFLKTLDNTFQVVFQDFGVGLSPERFNSVYKNIGASTKRNSNGQIGGFGIGKFAPLSYTNMVTIISNFEGKQYLYIIHKDGTSVSIDLITESDTQEPNGVAISINLEQEADLPRFTTAILSQLAYFENIHIENKLYRTEEEIESLGLDGDYTSTYMAKATDNINTFNNLRIKRYKNYAINSGLEGISTKADVIIGRVRYPLDMSQFSFDVSTLLPETIQAWEEVQGKDYSALAFLNPPISILCDIGELNITPNREQVLYSKLTKDILSNKYVLAIAEFIARHKSVLEGDYKDLKEYVNVVLEERKFNLFEDSDDSVLYFKFPREFQPKFSLNGKKYNKYEVELFNKALAINIPKGYPKNYYFSDFFSVIGYGIRSNLNMVFTQNRVPQHHSFTNSHNFKQLFLSKHKFVLLDKPFSSLTQLDKFYLKTFGTDLIFFDSKRLTYKKVLSFMIRMLTELSTETGKPAKIRKIEDIYDSSIYDTQNETTATRLIKKNKALYKYYLKIASVVVRYIFPISKKLYLHKTENIPEDVQLAYKEELKLKKSLKEKSVYNEVLSIEESEVSKGNANHSARVLSTEKPYTEKIQNIADKANKGTVYIHYDKSNQGQGSFIKSLAYWMMPQFPKNAKLIAVAPTKRKLLNNIHKNIISFEEMVEDSKIMRNLVTALYISVKCPDIAQLYKYNKAYIQVISKDMYNTLEEISEYFQYMDAVNFNSGLRGSNTSRHMIKSFKKEILEKGMKDNLYHLAVKENFDKILPELNKLLSALNLFRVKKADSFGSIPLSSLPVVVDFLHRNKIIKIPISNLISSRLELKYLLNNNS